MHVLSTKTTKAQLGEAKKPSFHGYFQVFLAGLSNPFSFL